MAGTGPRDRSIDDLVPRWLHGSTARHGWGLMALALAIVACGDAGAAPQASTTVPPPTTFTTIVPPTTTSTPASPTTQAAETPESIVAATTTEPPSPLRSLALDVLTEEVHRPVFVTAPAGDARLFIVEQRGTVMIVDPDHGLRSEPFLDITDRVPAGGIEQGLLGMAFHPYYRDNGRFFAYYTDRNDDSRLVEFAVSTDHNRADPATERLLLTVPQPTVRHNGGMLQFGPDGYLYVTLGDGGAAHDNAQQPGTLLGSLLRLDVDGDEPYGIPSDNPHADAGGAPEVWAHGLRNPWRFSIDGAEQLVYVADVGQEDWEEISIVSLEDPAPNLGWPITEGSHCFSESGCDTTGLVLPAVEYDHSEGCSVTGGYVYRGSAIPEMAGHYFYADWCGGWVRSFRLLGGRVVDHRDWSEELGPIGQITSFGIDAQGELYVTTWEGLVGKIVPVR